MSHSHRFSMLLNLVMLLALVACQAPSTAEPTKTPLPTHTPPPTETLIPTQTPNPFPNPTLNVVGEEEVVFDWSVHSCAARNIPDLPSRAFRDGSGQVQLILSHSIGYRMLGPDLNHLKIDCSHTIMSSHHSPDPALYSDEEWVAAPYTEDGTTVYAIVHNEYQGHLHSGQCPQNTYLPCWYNTLTLAVSTDGGNTYNNAAAPADHLVASLPFPYEAGAGPYGIMNPSNIIKGMDGYYYEFVKIAEYQTTQQRVCLMRTQDLSDPASWRFWNGSDFNGRFANPYKDDVTNPKDYLCEPIAYDNIGAQMVESVTYNTYLNRYVLVGISAYSPEGREVWGFYYAFSNDLIHWTHRKLLVEMPLPWTVNNAGSDLSYLYPSLLDPNSESQNFETTGKTAYLYYTRNNAGFSSLDRDLIRVPVEFFPTEDLGPVETNGFAWEFESERDMDGWEIRNDQLTPLRVSNGHLITESIGNDPFMGSAKFAVDAKATPEIRINMKVSSGEWAQLFFVTDTDGAYDEAKSLRFAIQGDGKFHEYVLDISKVKGWENIITQIRFDPTEVPAKIEIDYIRMVAR